MKLAAYHKGRGDEVVFVRGCSLEASASYWDRIYLTSLFTYDWKKVLEAVHFYCDNLFGASTGKVIVGGIAATLCPIGSTTRPASTLSRGRSCRHGS